MIETELVAVSVPDALTQEPTHSTAHAVSEPRQTVEVPEQETAIKDLPPRSERQKKELPIFDGTPGRKYSDEEINNILDFLLEHGETPEGTARERMLRNYPYHARLLERTKIADATGIILHAKFVDASHWRKWSERTGSAVDDDWYKRLRQIKRESASSKRQ